MNNIMILPGQTVIAEWQGDQFFKGDKYVVDSVYSTIDFKTVMGILGKNGVEYKFKCDSGYFSMPIALSKEHRKLAAKYLIQLSLVSDTSLHISKGWGGDSTINYKINAIGWQSGRPTLAYESTILANKFVIDRSIQDRSKKPWKHSNSTKIELNGDIEVVADWLIKEVKDDFESLHVGDSIWYFTNKMLDICHQATYEFPKLDHTVKPDIIYDDWSLVKEMLGSGKYQILKCLDILIKKCKSETLTENADILRTINIIANMFRLIPASYGSTYIAKVLTGKNVKLTDKVSPYHGELKDINYRTIFNMTTIINTFLFITGCIEDTNQGPKPEYIGHHRVNDDVFNLYFPGL